jgi:hypothetical protein
MRQDAPEASGGLGKFFLICLAHDSLFNYYKMNFALKQYYNYDIEMLENMIPFEREVYVALLLNYIEEEKKRLENRKK